MRVFTLSEGRLVWMSVEGTHRDLFSWGGSAGNGSAVDCLPGQPGRVVYSVYSYGEDPDDGLYEVTRQVYRGAGTSFALVTESKHRVHWEKLTETFPEFGGYPFDGCPGRIPAHS